MLRSFALLHAGKVVISSAKMLATKRRGENAALDEVHQLTSNATFLEEYVGELGNSKNEVGEAKLWRGVAMGFQRKTSCRRFLEFFPEK